MKVLLAFGSLALALGASALSAGNYAFEKPELLTAGGEAIVTESPGFAAPCLADLDGDGINDLLVGQFKSGKIGFYKGLKTEPGKLSFAARKWLQAGGEDAVVPGVW